MTKNEIKEYCSKFINCKGCIDIDKDFCFAVKEEMKLFRKNKRLKKRLNKKTK
jgi:hypothetical protein